MKLYKDNQNLVYSYPIDGSQDHLTEGKTPITRAEAEQLFAARMASKGIPLVPEYLVKRSAAYPDVTEFLDAWVKDDQDALENYRKKCLAVKAKFPKPEGF